jgi:hypothetical protein
MIRLPHGGPNAQFDERQLADHLRRGMPVSMKGTYQ